MKKILLAGLIVISFLSCKKTPDQQSAAIDTLSFGLAYNFCVGDCAQFYKIENGKIYPDNFTTYTGPASVVFSSTALSNDKYLLAKELLDNFPAYLLNDPDQTYGCPDCTDQGGIHIEIKKGSITQFWHIDTDIRKQPLEIRDYIARMTTILSQL